jgi:hypothetical protein
MDDPRCDVIHYQTAIYNIVARLRGNCEISKWVMAYANCSQPRHYLVGRNKIGHLPGYWTTVWNLGQIS